MSSELVPTEGEPSQDSFETALVAEQAVERTLMHSIARSIAIGIPIGILFFMALLWLAVGDDTEWYVIVGLGCGLGLLAAVLFGMLAGVTLNAHAMEAVDRGEVPHDPVTTTTPSA
jgi:hypothetical protein